MLLIEAFLLESGRWGIRDGNEMEVANRAEGPKRVWVRTGERNRRSLHYAPPDFLSRSVALINCMRLSREPHTWSLLAVRSRKSGGA